MSNSKIHLHKCSDLNCQQLPELVVAKQETDNMIDYALFRKGHYECKCGKKTRTNVLKDGGIYFLANEWNLMNPEAD